MTPVNQERAAAYEIALTEYFEAPRELVFQNWIEAELVRAWFAPDGFAVSQCEVDARPGSRWQVAFESADGERHTESGEFLEIIAPERLVFTLTQQDDHGRSGTPTVVTVTFAQVGARTRMDFHQSGYRHEPTRDANAEGWAGCFRKLTTHLATQPRVSSSS